jgi:hypothetical protein
MIIETYIYPADEPWLSLGYTKDRVSSSALFKNLTDAKTQLPETLAVVDEFVCLDLAGREAASFFNH